MWKTPAASAPSNGWCEGWDRFTVPRFAWTGYFHGWLDLFTTDNATSRY